MKRLAWLAALAGTFAIGVWAAPAPVPAVGSDEWYSASDLRGFIEDWQEPQVSFAQALAVTSNGRARINPNPGFLIGRSGGGRAGRLTVSGASASPSDAGTPFAFNFAQTGAACQCVDVTGLKGEAINFSRASVAYCTKGNETTGIANGDIVECASNKPRIMPGLDGTGGLGLAVWDSRRNGLLFSQQFDNAAWTKESSCTVTPDVAIAPDGTLTADLMTCPGAGDIYQFAVPVNYAVRSVYARAPYLADGGSQTISDFTVCGGSCGGSPVVTLSSDYWVRVNNDNQSDISAFLILFKASGGSVLLWQADGQDNTSRAAHPFPPPIKTTSAAVTRPAEVVSVPVYVAMQTALAVSATYVPESFADDSYVVDLGNHDGVNGFAVRVATSLTCENEVGASHSDVVGTVLASSGGALACTYDGSATLQACVGATCVDAGTALPPATTELTLGSHWNAFVQQSFINGVIKSVSVTEPALKNVILFGDSIVENNTAGAGYHPQEIIRAARGNSVAIQNDGKSAWTIDQIKAQWDLELAAVAAGGEASRTHFMMQGGINSQYDDGGNSGGAAYVVGKLKAMIASGRDAGVHVLWSTITPDCVGGAGSIAFVENVNAPMRAYCTSTGTPYAETFRNLESPADSGCLNLSYAIVDGVHLNDAGSIVETNVWMQAGGW